MYVSAAQVKRCELVPGDRISGPRRAPRRSERFASLIRIDTINGRPAEEVADSTRFDDLPAAFPSERFRLGSDDPTIKAIEWLTPFGQGSRVTIVGPARAGKTEALRRLAETLSGNVPTSSSRWSSPASVRRRSPNGSRVRWRPPPRSASRPLPMLRPRRVERVVDQARRLAARGSHAVVLIDTLDGLQPHAARKLLAAARNIADGGSLTVIATAPEPIGGETTVIALDPVLASTGRFPALDLLRQRDDPGRAAGRRRRRRGDRAGPRRGSRGLSRRYERPCARALGPPVSRRCSASGGAAPPCSAAPARDATAAESMSASRAPTALGDDQLDRVHRAGPDLDLLGRPVLDQLAALDPLEQRGVVAAARRRGAGRGGRGCRRTSSAGRGRETRPRRRGTGRRRRSGRA